MYSLSLFVCVRNLERAWPESSFLEPFMRTQSDFVWGCGYQRQGSLGAILETGYLHIPRIMSNSKVSYRAILPLSSGIRTCRGHVLLHLKFAILEVRGISFIFFTFSFWSLFIFERERETDSETSSRYWAISTEPDSGLVPTNCEIMTWAWVRCLTDWAT